TSLIQNGFDLSSSPPRATFNYPSFVLKLKEIDVNDLLCQLAKKVPESFETIEIRMGTFSADSLRNFFEGWRCKGRGENKGLL
ncbi:8190_t:CDS:2, partial [Diversispora eburnea]